MIRALRRHPGIIIGATLLAARIALTLALWRPGWSALTWDDFARVGLGLAWAREPFVGGGTWWLPGSTWLYGLAFRATGETFLDNPLALAAVLNTGALIGTAGVLAGTAWSLFRSPAGSLVVFGVVLFAPWSTFTSLSGLSEPVFYLGGALAAFGLTLWCTRGRLAALALGAAGVMLGAALRYEGWPLAVAWLVALEVSARWTDARPPTAGRGRAVLALGLAPLSVPALWLAATWLHAGTPLAFLQLGQHYFAAGVSAAVSGEARGARLLLYPLALVKSAGLLLPAIAVAALATWRETTQVRPLIGFLLVDLVLLSATALVSIVADLPERVLFHVVLGLTPLLGAVPGLLWRRVAHPGARYAIASLLLAVTAATFVAGARDRPVEWAHAPDLLELNAMLGTLATEARRPLRVGLGPGLTGERIPLAVQNGRRIVLTPTDAAVQPPALPPGLDLWIEKLPGRVAALPADAGVTVGRFHVYGGAAGSLPVDLRRCGECGGWTKRDETGRVTVVPPSSILALEFTSDDPAAGAVAAVERRVRRGPASRAGRLRLHWPYGRGFNQGRVAIEPRLDGQPLARFDLGARSRGRCVSFVIPAGPGHSILAVVITALPGIEAGWAWGRASTVLVDRVQVAPLPDSE